jgi:peptidoglycan/LPS O-acetylase OafA/YrhL
VFLAHANELSNASSLGFIHYFLSSGTAVKVFFTISGFLIIMSYERSQSLKSYAQKRFKRIYPGYIVSILLFAAILPVVERAPYEVYTSWEYVKYLLVNSVFLNFIAPGVQGIFDNNSLHAINGALWTIKIEVMFYICVPFIAFSCKRQPFYVLAMLYTIGFLYPYIIENMGGRQVLSKQFPGQIHFFAAGMAIYYFYGVIATRIRVCVIFAILGLILHYTGISNILYPLALAIGVYFFAFRFPALDLSKIGDLSYGVYIIHFPIVQVMVSQGVFRYSERLGLLLASVTVLLGSYLMWHLIEKRFLLRNNHYVDPDPAHKHSYRSEVPL